MNYIFVHHIFPRESIHQSVISKLFNPSGRWSEESNREPNGSLFTQFPSSQRSTCWFLTPESFGKSRRFDAKGCSSSPPPRKLYHGPRSGTTSDSREARILVRSARSIRSSPRNVRQEISIPVVRSGWNERLGAPASFRHESARRKGHGKNRRMSEMAEAPLRRTTSYPRQQLAAGYGYWPSLADRPVSCAPRRRCGILLRGQEEAVHVDEAVCRFGPATISWRELATRNRNTSERPSSRVEGEPAGIPSGEELSGDGGARKTARSPSVRDDRAQRSSGEPCVRTYVREWNRGERLTASRPRRRRRCCRWIGPGESPKRIVRIVRYTRCGR